MGGLSRDSYKIIGDNLTMYIEEAKLMVSDLSINKLQPKSRKNLYKVNEFLCNHQLLLNPEKAKFICFKIEKIKLFNALNMHQSISEIPSTSNNTFSTNN